jgi:hypothetical protein
MHCTPQYVLNLFVNLHGWFSGDCICFLGLESASSRCTCPLPTIALNLVSPAYFINQSWSGPVVRGTAS